jgi:hypothetical protein
MQVNIYTREKVYMINMVKGYLPCFPFTAAQNLLPYSLESSRAMKRLNNNDQKQVIQTIKK